MHDLNETPPPLETGYLIPPATSPISPKTVFLPPNHPLNPTNEGVLISFSTAQSWGDEINIDAPSIVPDKGTRTVGICGAGGGFVYGQVCGGVTIDSAGDVYLHWSPEGGTVLLGTASTTVYYATSNADDGELLLGPYMDAGGSGGELIVLGYEYSTMDSNGLHSPGGKIDQHKYSLGIGINVDAGPVEAHIGGGNTIKISPTINLYEALNIQPENETNQQ